LAGDDAGAGNMALEGEMMSVTAAVKLDMPEIQDVHSGISRITK